MSRRDATASRREPPRRRVEAPDAIEAALARPGEVALVLHREGGLSAEARSLVDRARRAGVPTLEASAREMRRMSGGEASREVLALAAAPIATSLEALLAADGPVLLLAGLRFPGNVGFILRSAEVAGAAGVVIANDWGRPQLGEALRIGMHAERFAPVVESEAEAAIEAARAAGRRVIGVETSGRRAPWEVDLRVPIVLVVGGESEGLSARLLAGLDEVVRIPTRGFIPSYNVQAAVGMLLGEWLRQHDGQRDA